MQHCRNWPVRTHAGIGLPPSQCSEQGGYGGNGTTYGIRRFCTIADIKIPTQYFMAHVLRQLREVYLWSIGIKHGVRTLGNRRIAKKEIQFAETIQRKSGRRLLHQSVDYLLCRLHQLPWRLFAWRLGRRLDRRMPAAQQSVVQRVKILFPHQYLLRLPPSDNDTPSACRKNNRSRTSLFQLCTAGEDTPLLRTWIWFHNEVYITWLLRQFPQRPVPKVWH